MAERTYVPGYGYVTKGEAGTGSSSGPRNPRPASPVPSNNGSQRGAASGATGTPGAVAGGAVTNPTLPTLRPTTGVPFPLSGYGGFGGLGGFEYGRRMGDNPDTRELFPYGVAFREQGTSTDAFYELDADYQLWLDNLAENPLIGTSASTGRMLWERINRLSAERTERGEPASPQQIAAEIAASVGLPPNVGRDREIDWSGSSGGGGSYGGGGGGGYGGGGGGGSVSLTNPTSAKGLLMQTMQGALGRIPTDAEYKLFIKTLNEAEMDAPRTVDVEGDLAVQSGGVDPGVVAMDFVEGLPEFNSAAGQRTLDSFMQVLGA